LFALWVTGGTWNIYSQIGIITLVGLITKHGILIVEFVNQLQERGLGIVEAVKQAAEMRLRPILMTTGAMVLGAVPLALSVGAGAESRIQIGWVIVGGLTFGHAADAVRRAHDVHADGTVAGQVDGCASPSRCRRGTRRRARGRACAPLRRSGVRG